MRLYTFIVFLFFINTTSFASVFTIGDVDYINGTYHLDSNIANKNVYDVERFLTTRGVPVTIGNDAYSGSAVKGIIQIRQGDFFRFAWEWSTSEKINSFFNDFAFVSLILNDNIIFNDIDIFANISTKKDQSYSWMATGSGVLSYGIGVMDAYDNSTHSSLNISNIKVEVPESATIWLFLLGLTGFIIMGRISSKSMHYESYLNLALIS